MLESRGRDRITRTSDVDVEDDGTLLVLRLHGELDLMSVPTVEETVDRHGGRQAVVVDLRDLEFMDSSGLRMIIELRNRGGGTPVSFAGARRARRARAGHDRRALEAHVGRGPARGAELGRRARNPAHFQACCQIIFTADTTYA